MVINLKNHSKFLSKKCQNSTTLNTQNKKTKIHINPKIRQRSQYYIRILHLCEVERKSVYVVCRLRQVSACLKQTEDLITSVFI